VERLAFRRPRFFVLQLYINKVISLHNEELHNLYFWPIAIIMIMSRTMKWAGHVARTEEERNSYRILMRKRGGRRPLGRPRRRCVDNIKIDLTEIGWNGMDWIDLIRIETRGGLL
jgi:hypothetical protein